MVHLQCFLAQGEHVQVAFSEQHASIQSQASCDILSLVVM